MSRDTLQICFLSVFVILLAAMDLVAYKSCSVSHKDQQQQIEALQEHGEALQEHGDALQEHNAEQSKRIRYLYETLDELTEMWVDNLEGVLGKG